MVRVIAELHRLVQSKIRSRGTRFYGRLSGNGYDDADKRNNDGWSHGRPPHPSFPAQLVE